MTANNFRFGTVGSPKSTPKKPGGSVGAVLRIAELGMNALELGWVRSVRVSEKTCGAIQKAAREKDVALSVHAPYFINLNANDEEWPKSRKRLMDAAYYGYLAGATDIVFHPGSYFGKPADEVLPKVLKRLAGCVDELKSNKIGVTLRPETMGKASVIGSLEDTLAMSKQVPGVLPCLDFAHLHARPGNGTMNTYDEWAHTLDVYGNTLGDKSLSELHIHLSGIEYTQKGEKNHLPIEEADLDVRAIFKALNNFGAGGRILCESPLMEEDALLLKQIWEEITG